MGDMQALRDFIYRRMEQRLSDRSHLTVNKLFNLLHDYFDGDPPLSRATLYSWFGHDLPQSPPTALLLECVPAFAEIFSVKEYEFFRAARIITHEIDASLSLIAAATDLRNSVELASQTLARAGLSTEGEALVVDRILHHGLDFKITVRPITRGASKPIHLHSWIILDPIEPLVGRRRKAVRNLQEMSLMDRRDYIREAIISDSLWRSLGLRWLSRPGPEWPFGTDLNLCIEVPVEQRTREPVLSVSVDSPVDQLRILALSAPFAHAELLVAFVAQALGFGTYDLRYQGFHEGSLATDEALAFCQEKLEEARPRYAWSIAQTEDVLSTLHSQIVSTAARNLNIVITYGMVRRAFGSRVWHKSRAQLLRAQRTVLELARDVNRQNPIIWIDYEDSDYSITTTKLKEAIDFDEMIDHVRYSAAEVLNHIYFNLGGPELATWGPKFDDLRRGASATASTINRKTRVLWCGPGELQGKRRDR